VNTILKMIFLKKTHRPWCFALQRVGLQQLFILYSLLFTASAFLLTGCMTAEPRVVKLEKANALPLQINSNFAFRKETQFLNDPSTFRTSHSEAVNFQRRAYMWPATTSIDKNELRGNYFNFYWWNHGPEEDVTIRFEYRQAGLGNEVLAREISYPKVHGSICSIFKIIGDDYLENGRVTCWRALLIVNNRIVAVTQSFLWQ
jgi:hypothetical protein